MDGTVVCVPKRSLAAEGGKAGDQTHQSHRDADPGNHKDKKLLNTSPKLYRKKSRTRTYERIRLILNLNAQKYAV